MLSRRAMASSASSASRLFLGLDSSTQGIKAVAINQHNEVVYTRAINYDKDLPHYKTVGGVHISTEDPGVVTQPTAMFVEAFETLLDDMRGDGFSFELVDAVSGSGQQHGSCYWRSGASSWLESEEAAESTDPLYTDVSRWLSVPDSPIWMDSSTTAECEAMEKAAGLAKDGGSQLAALTGSRAYERFTGPQVARMARLHAGLAECERVSLVSSFMCSLLAGKVASIDLSDGSGMNLLDISEGAWSDTALRAASTASAGAVDVERLASLLGEPVPSHTVVSTSPWKRLQRKYGFRADCAVVAWSGDNPNSVAGLGLVEPGDIAVSLGTSDTVFGISSHWSPAQDGHVFVSPCNPEEYMAMVCFKNGSLTRERVATGAAAVASGADGADTLAWMESVLLEQQERDEADEFASLASAPLSVCIDHPEITPALPAGDCAFTSDGTPLLREGEGLPAGVARGALSPEQAVQAVVEARFLAVALHSRALGLDKPRRVLLTGGASRNKGIRQVAADVLGAPVVTSDVADSAAFGAALRARHGLESMQQGSRADFPVAPASAVSVETKPRPAATAVYEARMEVYRQCEEAVLAGDSSKKWATA